MVGDGEGIALCKLGVFAGLRKLDKKMIKIENKIEKDKASIKLSLFKTSTQ